MIEKLIVTKKLETIEEVYLKMRYNLVCTMEG